MNNKELYYFLGRCLSMGDDNEFTAEFKALASSGSINWERIVWLASSHLITPVIYIKFRENNVLDCLPADLISYFEEIYALNRNRNKAILLQTEEINRALNPEGIYPIYLKGAGNLIDGLYNDIGERIMVDIDFLTSEQDFLKSVGILKNLGYEATVTPDSNISIYKHYPRMMRDDTAAGIEIHRLPVIHKYLKWFNYDIIAGEMKMPADNAGCLVLSDRHKILLGFMHSQLVHRGHWYGTASLKDVYDLYLLSGRIKDREDIIPGKFEKKAFDYFGLAGRITGTPVIKTIERKRSFSLFLIKHDLNLTSKGFRSCFRILNIIIMAAEKLSGYIYTLGTLFISEKAQHSLKRKLSDRSWYSKHLESWKRIFRG